LTKHKPKGNEEKQKREVKTGSAVKKKQNNGVFFVFYFFIKWCMQNLWWGDLQTIKEKAIKQNNN
jgi:hypothetical protein